MLANLFIVCSKLALYHIWGESLLFTKLCRGLGLEHFQGKLYNWYSFLASSWEGNPHIYVTLCTCLSMQEMKYPKDAEGVYCMSLFNRICGIKSSSSPKMIVTKMFKELLEKVKKSSCDGVLIQGPKGTGKSLVLLYLWHMLNTESTSTLFIGPGKQRRRLLYLQNFGKLLNEHVCKVNTAFSSHMQEKIY